MKRIHTIGAIVECKLPRQERIANAKDPSRDIGQATGTQPRYHDVSARTETGLYFGPLTIDAPDVVKKMERLAGALLSYKTTSSK